MPYPIDSRVHTLVPKGFVAAQAQPQAVESAAVKHCGRDRIPLAVKGWTRRTTEQPHLDEPGIRRQGRSRIKYGPLPLKGRRVTRRTNQEPDIARGLSGVLFKTWGEHTRDRSAGQTGAYQATDRDCRTPLPHHPLLSARFGNRIREFDHPRHFQLVKAVWGSAKLKGMCVLSDLRIRGQHRVLFKGGPAAADLPELPACLVAGSAQRNGTQRLLSRSLHAGAFPGNDSGTSQGLLPQPSL